MPKTEQAGFVTVQSEGGLLPPDTLARIAASDPALGGLTPADYGLGKGDRLSEAAARAWANCKAHWASFMATYSSLAEGESGVTETREQWVLPLFRELGYGRLVYHAAAEAVNDQLYPISHRAGEGEGRSPIHIVSAGQDLDRGENRRLAQGGLRISPYGLLQDYLNRTRLLWGVVTNGTRLRLLRTNESLTRAAFIEFDLEAMLEGGMYADFVLLFLLLHRSRLPENEVHAAECWLEKWRLAAVEGGTRALDGLRSGVTAALTALGQGVLAHPANEELRVRMSSGTLSVADYYRQLLRLVYRFLFLLVAEERDLLFGPDAGSRERAIYAQHYSLSRLRAPAERKRGPDSHDDLWRALRVTFRLMREGATSLKLAPLAGGLFDERSCPDLDGALVPNDSLCAALRGLSFVKVNKVTRRVNYRDLGVEELGSVYESLLDLHPRLLTNGGVPRFELIELVSGSEHKTTGSYYTPPALVNELIKSALEPVIARALASGRTVEEKRRAVLRLSVCDPASGSGHFLLAAARRIGREIARLDAGEMEPDLVTLRNGVREAIRHCIYGVDLNPLAVDLCKLALWLEGHTPGRPLTFLDHRIKCGNSLVGATPEALENGIPDEAFTPVSGESKAKATQLKKRNRLERAGQERLPFGADRLVGAEASDDEVLEALEIGDLPEENVTGLQAKAERYRAFNSATLAEKRFLADAWTATFFWPLESGVPDPPTEADFRSLWRGERSLAKEQHEYIAALAQQHRCFHWHLEYAEIFADAAGFACVLGNPPWEMLQLDPREFFLGVAPAIANASNMAVRDRMIAKLESEDANLFTRYLREKHTTEAYQKFVHASGRFPLTSYGRINLMALFAEHARNQLAPSGRAGLIVPTGIATDEFCKYFFGDLSQKSDLVSLYDFVNSAAIFPGVHRSYKFCLITIGATNIPTRFCFFATNPRDLEESQRTFTLTAEEIQLINPNTLTCPTFRTQTDAELTKKIYRHVPILFHEETGASPWGFKGLLMFMMNTDSSKFQTRPGEGLLPLYEAKLMHQYTHRWATYAGKDARDLTTAELQDPDCTITPRYWVARQEVEARLAGRWERKWLLGWRRIARTTDERTVVASLLPKVASGDSLFFMLPQIDNPLLISCLLASLNTLVFDYVARQKVGGVNLNFYIMNQFPVLPPSAFSPEDIAYISERVLELVYTAWDMRPFAEDVWAELDAAGRERVLGRWEESTTSSLRSSFVPLRLRVSSSLLPPFRWDDERRAHLRAELDAYYARLYGLSRKQLRYILDPNDLTDRELADILDPAEDPPEAPRTKNFPGETFRVLKEREMKQYGAYRTKRLVLEAWDRLQIAGVPAVTEKIKAGQ